MYFPLLSSVAIGYDDRIVCEARTAARTSQLFKGDSAIAHYRQQADTWPRCGPPRIRTASS